MGEKELTGHKGFCGGARRQKAVSTAESRGTLHVTALLQCYRSLYPATFKLEWGGIATCPLLLELICVWAVWATAANFTWIAGLTMKHWTILLARGGSIVMGTGRWSWHQRPGQKSRSPLARDCGSFDICRSDCNALTTFERLMEKVLLDIPLSRCLVYLDNLFVRGEKFCDAITNLREVSVAIQKVNLWLHLGKCRENKTSRWWRISAALCLPLIGITSLCAGSC